MFKSVLAHAISNPVASHEANFVSTIHVQNGTRGFTSTYAVAVAHIEDTLKFAQHNEQSEVTSFSIEKVIRNKEGKVISRTLVVSTHPPKFNVVYLGGSVSDGYQEAQVELGGEVYELVLQLPNTPDSQHTVDGEHLNINDEEKDNHELHAALYKCAKIGLYDRYSVDNDKTCALLSFALGREVDSYEENEDGQILAKVGDDEYVLELGRASSYYNVEYYDLVVE